MKFKNRLVKSNNNASYKIGELIGSSNRFEMYYDITKRYIIKICLCKTFYEKDNLQKKIKYLIKTHLPEAIIKPIDLFEVDNCLGYVIESPGVSLNKLSEINDGYESNENFTEWFNNSSDLEKRLQIAINLGFVFLNLDELEIHLLELNMNEIFIDNGLKIFLPCIENLSTELYINSNIFLELSNITPETPPELANNTSVPDSYSDAYIYAVIVFNLLTLTFPYYGTEKEYQMFLKGNYSSALLYIKDCEINSQQKIVFHDDFLTTWLHLCFTKTFKHGTIDRCARAKTFELLKACILSYNLCFKCPICQNWGYFFINDICPSCKETVPHISRIAFYKQAVISEKKEDNKRINIKSIKEVIKQNGISDSGYTILLKNQITPIHNFYCNENNTSAMFKINYQVKKQNNSYYVEELNSQTKISQIYESQFTDLDFDGVYRGKIITGYKVN